MLCRWYPFIHRMKRDKGELSSLSKKRTRRTRLEPRTFQIPISKCFKPLCHTRVFSKSRLRRDTIECSLSVRFNRAPLFTFQLTPPQTKETTEIGTPLLTRKMKRELIKWHISYLTRGRIGPLDKGNEGFG